MTDESTTPGASGGISINPAGADPTKEASSNVRDPDLGEKDDWERLLGDRPNLDIDTGVAILRISEDNEGGRTTWLPNNTGENKIEFTVRQASPEPGDPVDLAAFLNCMSASLAAGQSYP